MSYNSSGGSGSGPSSHHARTGSGRGNGHPHRNRHSMQGPGGRQHGGDKQRHSYYPPNVAQTASTSSNASSSSNPSLHRTHSNSSHHREGVAGSDRHKQSFESTESWKRLLFVLMNMVGSRVQVTVKGGVVYEGLFHTCSLQSDNPMGICLKMAKKISLEGGPSTAAPIIQNLVILGKDVCHIHVPELEFVPEKEEFKTDTAISGHGGEIKERELQKWEPSNEDSVDHYDRKSGTEWDQFAVNEKLFGVTTDFKEEIYTTTLDKSDPDFKKKEAHAIKMANEILKSQSGYAHVAEERGLQVDDDMNEEDKYSSVIRGPGKYVPPGARKEQPPKEQPPINKPKEQPIQASDSTAQDKPKRWGDVVKGSKAEKAPATTSSSKVDPVFENIISHEQSKVAREKQILTIRRAREKQDLLANLKNFSANLKLSTPVPPDIAELLGKESKRDRTLSNNSSLSVNNESTDSESVIEQQETKEEKKQQQPVEARETIKKPQPDSPPKTTTTTQPPTLQNKPDESKQSKFKFNVKAAEFKFNVGASEFKPTDAASDMPKEQPFFGTKQVDKTKLSITHAFLTGFKHTLQSNPKSNSTSATWDIGSQPYKSLIPTSVTPMNAPIMLPRMVPVEAPFEEGSIYVEPNMGYGYPMAPFGQHYRPMMNMGRGFVPMSMPPPVGGSFVPYLPPGYPGPLPRGRGYMPYPMAPMGPGYEMYAPMMMGGPVPNWMPPDPSSAPMSDAAPSEKGEE